MIHSLIYTLAMLVSFSCAFPLHFHRHELEKRQVITRVHTASTTNTVTDFYSTTTRIVVAPTVEFIISGSATYTTTLFPEGADATALPTATLTTVVQVKNVDISANSGAGGQDAQATTLAQNAASAPVTASAQNAAPAPVTASAQNTAPAQGTTSVQGSAPAQAGPEAATTAAAQTSAPSAKEVQYTVTTPAGVQPTISTADHQETTTLQGNQAGASESASSQSWKDAIGESVVYTSAVTQPPAQVHSTTPTTSSTFSDAEKSETTSFTSATSSSSDHAATSTTSAATSQTNTANSGNNDLAGNVPVAFTYSPYNSDGSCRSADNVYKDLQMIKSHGVSQVRIYGTDCNSLQTVQPACAKLGIKINQGLWIDSSGVESINDGVKGIIEYGQKNGWDIFEYITVGNEAIISGFCSVSDLISKIQSVKAQLRAAGYSGSVTTSEPPVSFENHPELCTSSAIDFVGINPHSYFNTEIDAAGAGAFVEGQVELIKKVCGTSNVVVTETGYPRTGSTNGKNVPSAANQKVAIESILSKLNNQVTILSYFDDLWKNPGPYGIEQSFGIQSLMG
ncbi:hypothetical protein HG536_0D04650 [Torulaspora globosa]|uniref:Glycoside hydrolase family 17 protein n=1 Tax=Torulaspora globosa TaxID=48254 RepID=A0A7G3ZHF7_9SACH|nr:uncharacterized protein HG536_0D04650 [Torulaspora globosa]QLL32943.1 hypothetical protein HG536_0D04650 [Torulaspora globosa]